MSNLEYEVLDLGLVYYPNVIKDPQKVVNTVEELERRYLEDKPGKYQTSVKPWVQWNHDTTGQTFCLQKFIPQVKNIPSDDIYKEEQTFISSELFGALDIAFQHYTKELYPFAEKNIKSREQTMHLLKYEKTGHLPAHQDQGISTRVLSVLLYLNDDYEGGEIEFQNSDLLIKPDPGSILFFPSNFLYIHEVHPVTSGIRYALPNWYHNVPLSDKRDSTGQE